MEEAAISADNAFIANANKWISQIENPHDEVTSSAVQIEEPEPVESG